MKIKFGKRHRFTVSEVVEMTGVAINTVRSQMYRLANKGVIKHVDTKRPQNVKVYESDIHPIELLKQGDFIPIADALPESTYFNNPFNMKNAIDWRWRYEEAFI